MTRHFIFMEKMIPGNALLIKNKNFNFTNFVKFFMQNKTQDFLTENDIIFVPRDHNPPNAPQIRPIENFFAILKQHVYAGNWSAKNREGLIRRIKKCVQEIDMDMIIKMFDNLPPKIVKAKNNGLESLL